MRMQAKLYEKEQEQAIALGGHRSSLISVQRQDGEDTTPQQDMLYSYFSSQLGVIFTRW